MKQTCLPIVRLPALCDIAVCLTFVLCFVAPLRAESTLEPQSGSSASGLEEAAESLGAETMPPESAVAQGGISGLQAKIQPDPVAFGGPFDLVIEVKHDAQLQIQLPQNVPEKAALPQVGIIRREVLPPAERGAATAARPEEEARPGASSALTRFTIPFLALDLKDLKTPAIILQTSTGETIDIPELPVPIRTEEDAVAGAPNPGPTDPSPAPSAPGASLELENAPGPILFSVVDERPFLVLLSCLFAGFVYWLYRRLSGRIFVTPPPKPVVVVQRPADEVALERLDALLAEGLLARNEIKLFVTRLMDEVLRDFLEARFAVAAGTRTTRELMVSLLETSATGLDVSGTRAVLEQADLVKFARAQLVGDAAHEMAERVRALIVATTAAASSQREPGAGS